MGFAFREQIRAIGALLMREALTRYGSSRIGYLWAVIEPAAFIAMFLVVREYLGRTVPIGENIALFMMSGLVGARITLNIANKIGAAIESNRALLVYPLVNPLDTIAARCVLEALTGMIVFVLFFAGLLLVAGDVTINDFATFSQGAMMLVVMGCSLGTFNAVLGTVLPAWTRVWALMSLPLFITSGIFFVPATLSPSILAVVWWNPLLHCVEWVRTGAYVTYDPLLDHAYPLTLSFVLLIAGLLLERIYRFRLLSL